MVSSYTLAYERILDPESSVQLSLGYRHYNLTPFFKQDTSDYYSGFTVTAEYRKYLRSLKRTAPKGLYFAPFVRYGNYREKYGFDLQPYYNFTYKITSWSGGLMIGYQLLIAKLISVDFFLGGQYKTRTLKAVFANPTAYGITPANYSRKAVFKDDTSLYDYIRLGLNIGITF